MCVIVLSEVYCQVTFISFCMGTYKDKHGCKCTSVDELCFENVSRDKLAFSLVFSRCVTHSVLSYFNLHSRKLKVV